MLSRVLAAGRRRLSTAAAGPSFGVGPDLVNSLRSMGILKPNAIQAEAVPQALMGRDVLCCAQTGSGKTLTFLLPMMQRLSERPNRREAPDGDPRSSCPEAIILVPNRELGEQHERVFRDLAEQLPFTPTMLRMTGGERFAPQKRALRAGNVRLLIATPERLLYHIGAGNMRLDCLSQLALDEADALLCAADGITRETDEVLQKLPRRLPQVVLACATLTAAHEEVARKWFPKITRVSHKGVLVPTLRQVPLALQT